MSGSFTYTPDQADLLTAFKLHYPAFQPKRLAIFVAFCALTGLAVAILAGDTSGIEMVQVIGGMVAFGLVVLASLQLVIRLWWMPRYTRRIFNQQAELRCEVNVVWNDVHFTTRTANSHADLAWKDFHQWNCNERMMLLYRSEAMFNFFPLDCAERRAAAGAMQVHLTEAGVKQRK